MPSQPTLRAAVLWSLILAMPSTSSAEPLPSDLPPDPFQWLEDVSGTEPLNWVRQRNAESMAALAESGAFRGLEARLLSILDSKERIPLIGRIAGCG